MPVEVDWDNVGEVQDFNPLPAGKYRCTVQNVDERMTHSGDKMWAIEYVVNEPPLYGGRKIFDNIVFSEAALPRAKLWAKTLGFNVEGKVVMTPGMVRGKPIILTTEIGTYTAKDGTDKKQTKVVFDGFESAVGEIAAETKSEEEKLEDLPF